MTIAFSKDTVILLACYNSAETVELLLLAREPLEIAEFYPSESPGYSDIYLGYLVFSRGIPTEWFTVVD